MEKIKNKEGLFLLLTLLFLAVSEAEAVIYKWEDEFGNIFFSDDLKKIPKEYRGQIEKRSSSDSGEKENIRSGSSILFEQKTDTNGNGKKWWQDLIKRWQEKKRNAETRIEEIKLEQRQLEFHRMLSAGAQEKEKRRMRKLIQAAQLRRDVAIRMLAEGIPEEARKADAPLEWLSDKP